MVLPFLEKELDPKIVEHICRSASYLREEPQAIRRAGPAAEPPEKSAAPGDAAPCGGYSLAVCAAEGYEVTPSGIGCLPACAWFCAEAVKGRTLEVRRWRDGDWMKPCGFPHRRKLQDVFVTAKTPPALRRELPIVADAETGEVLLWLFWGLFLCKVGFLVVVYC